MVIDSKGKTGTREQKFTMSEKALVLLNEVLYVVTKGEEGTKTKPISKLFGRSIQAIHKDFGMLVEAGVLGRNPDFSYYLIGRPEEITLSDVLDSVGYLVEPVPCNLCFGNTCKASKSCLARNFAQFVNQNFRHIYDSYTLGDLVKLP